MMPCRTAQLAKAVSSQIHCAISLHAAAPFLLALLWGALMANASVSALSGNDELDKADQHISNAEKLIEKRQFSQAKIEAQSAEKLLKKAPESGDLKKRVMLQMLIGQAFCDISEYGKAAQNAELSLLLLRTVGAPDNEDVGLTFYLIQQANAARGEYIRAIQAGVEFDRILAKTFGNLSEKRALPLRDLAYLFMKTNEFAMAEDLLNRSYSVLNQSNRTGNNQKIETRRKLDRGHLELARGHFALAEPLLIEALSDAGLQKEVSPAYPNCISDLAMVYLNSGRLQKAEPLINKAIESRLADGADRVGLAEDFARLGLLYSKLQKNNEALTAINKSIAIFETFENPHNPNLAETLRLKATVLKTVGFVSESQKIDKEAVRILNSFREAWKHRPSSTIPSPN